MCIMVSKFPHITFLIIISLVGLRQTEDSTSAFKKTVSLTKTPRTTLQRIIKFGAKKRKTRIDSRKFKKLDERLHSHIIRTTIYKMYEEKEVPTIASLHTRLQNGDFDINCSLSTLSKFVKKIGFRYKKINKGFTLWKV